MKNTKIIYYIVIAILAASCSKGYLDAKPTTNISSPDNLDVLQKILETNSINSRSSDLLISSADEYYFLTQNAWQSTGMVDRNAYVWEKDIYQGTQKIGEWNTFYSAILNSNVVLEEIDKIETSSFNSVSKDNIKGWALFNRAWAYHQLVETFSPAYDEESATSDLGVPLKLSPNADELKQRASLKDSYSQILLDLQLSTSLLPSTIQSGNPNRPSKPAACALLSRVYTSMRDYPNAEKWADSCLSYYEYLEDFNTISLPSNNPFVGHDKEIILFAVSQGNRYAAIPADFPFICIDSNLYDLYSTDDLRRDVFFRINSSGKPYSNRIYAPKISLAFTGLATDEIYLIKSECLIRRDRIDEGLSNVGKLLEKRYRTGKAPIFSSMEKAEALELILNERRKELIFRGIRWSDIKRLNKEGRNITLTRLLNDQTFLLTPNSPLFVLPIPDDEIAISGIQQNQR